MANKPLNEFSGIQQLKRKNFLSELGSFTVTFEPDLILNKEFYQDSISIIEKTGTIKGMHFQQGQHAQTKLVIENLLQNLFNSDSKIIGYDIACLFLPLI